jgi:GrpB-like predicted nucleotidyltransferase (UPF0157 family)
MTYANNQLCRTAGNILATGVFGVIPINHPFDEDMLAFYSNVYGRESEINHMPRPTRHLTFECPMENGYKLLFTGCEVNMMSEIPDGMHGLEISSDTLRIFKENTLGLPVMEAKAKWIWKDTLVAFGDSFVAGDIAAVHPIFHSQLENVPSGQLLFQFSENTYGNYGSSDYREDEIHLVEPDPSWPIQFEELKKWLCGTLPHDHLLKIEHYGSTSIPGMPAKPIVDMLVEVPSFESVRKDIVAKLCTEDCSYSFFMDHAVFTKRHCFGGDRIAHIHMAPKGHSVWQGVQFRDCLREKPDLAQEYADVKRELAAAYRNDRNHYTMGKDNFVAKVASVIEREKQNTKDKAEEGRAKI